MSKRARKTQFSPKARDTQNRIVDVCAELLLKEFAPTLKEIATQARITEQLIHSYFGGRRGGSGKPAAVSILEEIIDRFAQELWQMVSMGELFSSKDASPLQKLVTTIRAFLLAFNRSALYGKVVLKRRLFTNEEGEKWFGKAWQDVDLLILQAQETEELRRVSPASLRLMVMSFIEIFLPTSWDTNTVEEEIFLVLSLYTTEKGRAVLLEAGMTQTDQIDNHPSEQKEGQDQ